MKSSKYLLLLCLISISNLYANSLYDESIVASKGKSQESMLIDREITIKRKIEDLEIVKLNTQNPMLFKKTILELDDFYKELEVIKNIHFFLAQNGSVSTKILGED